MNLIRLVSMKKKIKLHRPIKFRAKEFEDRFYSDISPARWLYGYLCIVECGLIAIQKENGGEKIVRPESIGQFTGLHDKNGIEIYENDVIKVDCFLGESSYIVKWDVIGARFVFVNTESGGYLTPRDFNFDYIEVIGNTTDNLELAKY